MIQSIRIAISSVLDQIPIQNVHTPVVIDYQHIGWADITTTTGMTNRQQLSITLLGSNIHISDGLVQPTIK